MSDFEMKPWNLWLPATIVRVYAPRRSRTLSSERSKRRTYFDVHCPSLTTPLVRRQVAESLRPPVQPGLVDVRYDLQDGVLLCRALECLSGQAIPAADVEEDEALASVSTTSATTSATSLDTPPMESTHRAASGRTTGWSPSSSSPRPSPPPRPGVAGYGAAMEHPATSQPSHPQRVALFDPPENDLQRRHNLRQFLAHLEKVRH